MEGFLWIAITPAVTAIELKYSNYKRREYGLQLPAWGEFNYWWRHDDFWVSDAAVTTAFRWIVNTIEQIT